MYRSKRIFSLSLNLKVYKYKIHQTMQPLTSSVIILADTDVGDVAHTERHYGISRLYYQYSYISIYTISNMLELGAGTRTLYSDVPDFVIFQCPCKRL